jgi:hypothetical protein
MLRVRLGEEIVQWDTKRLTEGSNNRALLLA